MSCHPPVSEYTGLLTPAAPIPVRYDSLTEAELLDDSSAQRHDDLNVKKSYKWPLLLIFMMLIVVTAFIGFNTYAIAQNADELLGDAVEVEVYNVSLAGVNTKGIDVRVQGNALVNYDDIESTYFKTLFKAGAGALRTAAVRLDSVSLKTKIDGKTIKVGTVDVPLIHVNIVHGSHTPVDIIVSIHPNTAKLFGLIKEILGHPEEILKVYGSTSLSIALGGIPIGKFKVNFQQAITPNDYFDVDGNNIGITGLSITPVTEVTPAYNMSFSVSVPNPIKEKMISFQVPKLEWNIVVNDCNDKPTIPLFLDDQTVTSQPFKLYSFDKQLTISISSLISGLNEALSAPCPSGEHSPISKLVSGIMDNNTLPVRIQNVGGSDSYPSFINDILTKNPLDLIYHPSSNSSQLVHNTSMDNLGFEFIDGYFSNPVISGDINIFIDVPIIGLESSLSVKQARGIPILYHHGKVIGKVELGEWHDCLNEYVMDEDGKEYLHISMTLVQETVNITDGSAFAGVINEVLSVGSAIIDIKSDFDAVVQTLIGDIEIDGIHVDNQSEITAGSLFGAKSLWIKATRGFTLSN